MSTQPKAYITPEQYLEIERTAEYKSEYYAGEMFAMSGARFTHNVIAGNAIMHLGNSLANTNCHVLPSDMRVRVSATGLYTYPDVSVVCGDPLFAEGQQDTLLNPVLIIEVLSPSTEAYDRGRKFEHYKKVESLSEYMLIATDHVEVDLYTRKPDGWLLTSASEPHDLIELASVGARLRVADLYAKVELPLDAPGGPEPRGLR